jgi:hypothetical protein
MTDEQRLRKIELIADMAHEVCDAVLVLITWVNDEGDTMTYLTDRGNALTVEGMVYDLIAQQDEQAQPDYDEDE